MFGIHFIFFLCISLSIGFNSTVAFDPDGTQSASPVVMAYYVPENDYRPEQIPVEKLTHIIFSFTKVIDGEMKFRNPEESGKKLEQLVLQKKRNPELKVMIACGGWGADGFSDMALTRESRQKFIRSAVSFIEKYKLDGIDIDWEYPGISGAGTMARDEDREHFTSLMQELREALDRIGRPQVLTFASAGWKRYYNYVELDKVMPVVDFMNVMTYDQVGGSSPYTGHHTALGWITEKDMEGTPALAYYESRREEMTRMGRTWEPRSAAKIIDFCIQEGVDPSKIVIGAAFYGRAWKGVHPENNGLYQPNGGAYIGWSAYQQIRSEFEPDPEYTRYWDEAAKAPYLFNPVDSIFISYDDTVSVRLKTEYAIDKKLGGIMFWQLGNDTKEENSLLDAIYAARQRFVK